MSGEVRSESGLDAIGQFLQLALEGGDGFGVRRIDEGGKDGSAGGEVAFFEGLFPGADEVFERHGAAIGLILCSCGWVSIRLPRT